MNSRFSCFSPLFLAVCCALLPGLAAPVHGQELRSDFKEKVDGIISGAYRTAAEEFPCKLKTRGKPKMLHWQQVDRCLNAANNSVDWEDVSRRIQEIRKNSGYSGVDISSAIEAAISAHAVPYEKVFSVKSRNAFLPLTNSLLKFLPPESLQGIPVIEKSGNQLGEFSGVFSFEKSGGLTAANSYRMYAFQYTDPKGQMQTPAGSGRLLLDSYGVPWQDAKSHPGFRLNTDKLILKP